MCSDEEPIIELPILFKDSSLLIISTLYFESNNQTHELKVYPQLINYDQWGPPILDMLKNDEALLEFMGLWDMILHRYHKFGFDIKLDMHSYYGETIESFSCKS